MDLADLPPVLNVTDAADVLGIHRDTAYSLIKAGEFPTPVIKIGRRIKVPTAPLVRLVETGSAVAS